VALALAWSSRDRFSVAVYGLAQLLAATALTLLSRGHGALALLPVLGQMVFMLPARGVTLVAGYVALVTVAAVRLRSASWFTALGMAAGHLSGVVFVLAFAALFVRERLARIQKSELLAALGRANEQLRGFTAQAEELAAARERARIARDVHDIVGHSLTAVQAQLCGALAVYERDAERSVRLVQSALTLTEASLGDVRQSVSALRSEPGPSLIEELRSLFSTTEQMGLTAELLLQGEPYQPSAMVSLAVVRMVQECITNSRRHGAASRLRVTLIYGEGVLSAQVEDDGAGADGLVPGVGLNGIRERVTMLGGELKIEAQSGVGVRLAARIPVGVAPSRRIVSSTP